LQLPEGERVMILAPIVRGRKGEFKKELEKFAKDFTRARIDGEMRQLDEEIRLDKRKNHTIEIVIDRLLIKEGVRERLQESVKTALKLTGGAVLVSIVDGEEKLIRKAWRASIAASTSAIGTAFLLVQSSYGACKRCQGWHGHGTRANKILPDQSQPASKITFLAETDKAGGSSAVRFDRDHRKLAGEAKASRGRRIVDR
jgi:excinuclease ABC subunit A